MCPIRQHLISDYPRVEVHLEHFSIAQFVLFHKLGFPRFRIHVHAAEFVHFKFLSILSHTFLGEENRAWGCQVDGGADEDGNDSCENTANQSAADVHQALQEKLSKGCIVQTGSQHCVASNFFHKLSFASLVGDFCKVQMNGYAGFGELVDKLVRVWQIFGDDDQHLVDPLLADIHRHVTFASNNRDTTNFLTGTVLIDHYHSGKGISGIIVFLHAVHYVFGYRFGSDDQQLLVAAVFHFFM